MARAIVLVSGRSVRSLLPFLIFAAFIGVISYRVAPTRGVLMYGDYPYFWPGRAFDSFSVVESSFLGYLRSVGMQTTFLAEVPEFLSRFFTDNWSGYLLTYGILYTACLTYYFVAYRLTGSKMMGYTAGLFIVLNNVVFEYLVIQPSHVFAALIVYALTFYIFILALRDRFRFRHALVIGVMSLALTHPFFWVIEVVLLLGLFAFVIPHERRRVIAAASATLGMLALLAAYWIVPFVPGFLSSNTTDLYAGNQESVFEGVRAKVHYLEAFDLLQYPGTWQSEVYDGKVPHLFDFGTLAFVVLVFLLREHKSSRRTLFLFLLALYLAALNLGLGPNSRLTGGAWQFAYEHVPGFGFFRSFSRFLNLSLVALVFLVVLAFDRLRRDRWVYYPHALGLFLLLLVLSHSIFLTGDINGTITAGQVPKEYAALNDKYLDTPTEFSLITFPNIEYEAYRWNMNRRPELFQQITYFKEYYLEKPVIFNRLALNDLNIRNSYFPRLFAYQDRFRFYREFDDDLSKLDVRYVLVHKDLFHVQRVIERLPSLKTAEDAWEAGEVRYEWYKSYFSSRNRRYRLLEDNSVFLLYENAAYRPRIRSSSASFQKINDATYRVHLAGMRDARSLMLLQRFDAGWNIYPQRAPSLAWCQVVDSYANDLTECERGDGAHNFRDVSRLLGSAALDVPHLKALEYANEWRIDADSIRTQFGRNYYTVNPDGSIDVELLVYFRPQSYFYLGALITMATLVACLALLIGGVILRAHRQRRARAGIAAA